jgi:SET domain-containing protein
MNSAVNDCLLIKKSPIHNKGVFARNNIASNVKLIEYIGRKVTKKESREIEKKAISLSITDKSLARTYIFKLDDDFDIDGDVEGNDAKYFNHSCNPNAKYLYEHNRIWIVSIRNVRKGEEITFNYGFGFDEDFKDHPCKCGAKNCAGYILDEEDWPKLNRATQQRRQRQQQELSLENEGANKGGQRTSASP